MTERFSLLAITNAFEHVRYLRAHAEQANQKSQRDELNYACLYCYKGGEIINMDLFEKCNNVDSKDEFIQFLNGLRHYLQIYPDEWENLSLDAFLESIESWMEGTKDRGYLPDQPEWKSFAPYCTWGRFMSSIWRK